MEFDEVWFLPNSTDSSQGQAYYLDSDGQYTLIPTFSGAPGSDGTNGISGSNGSNGKDALLPSYALCTFNNTDPLGIPIGNGTQTIVSMTNLGPNGGDGNWGLSSDPNNDGAILIDRTATYQITYNVFVVNSSGLATITSQMVTGPDGSANTVLSNSSTAILSPVPNIFAITWTFEADLVKGNALALQVSSNTGNSTIISNNAANTTNISARITLVSIDE